MATITREEYIGLLKKTTTYMVSQAIVNLEKKITMKWIDAKEQLPIIDDTHEEGEVPYLGIYCNLDDYDEEDEDFPFMDIVYFYGKGWKNSRWEKVIVKYWLEIPEVPEK